MSNTRQLDLLQGILNSNMQISQSLEKLVNLLTPISNETADLKNCISLGFKSIVNNIPKNESNIADLNLHNELQSRQNKDELDKKLNLEQSKIKNWKTSLNKLKHHHFQMLRNRGLSEKYMEYCASCDTDGKGTFLPWKFRPLEIKAEPSDQQDLRISAAFQQLKYEAKLMISRANNHEKLVKEIQDQITSTINEEFASIIAQHLITRWFNEIDVILKKNNEIWSKKLADFISKENEDAIFIKERSPTKDKGKKKKASNDNNTNQASNNLGIRNSNKRGRSRGRGMPNNNRQRTSSNSRNETNFIDGNNVYGQVNRTSNERGRGQGRGRNRGRGRQHNNSQRDSSSSMSRTTLSSDGTPQRTVSFLGTSEEHPIIP